MQVHLKDLAKSCMTRRRGEEAYRELDRYLSRDVEIIIDGDYPITLPYLDEIITRCITNDKVGKILFVTDSSRIIRKLGIISGSRNVSLFRQSEQGRDLIEPIVLSPALIFTGGAFQ